MKILALECSASPCSCCVLEDGKLLGEYFINVKTTHSQTLLPMVDSLLNTLNIKISDIDIFAISKGPGSFTGVRIGISALKGMAFNKGKVCVGTSTLESMAYSFLENDCVVVATMDARCNQFYNGIYLVKDGKVSVIFEDSAEMCEELDKKISSLLRLKKYKKLPIILCGDGAELFYQKTENKKSITLSSVNKRFQHSSGVAVCAKEKIMSEELLSADELMPLYLRLPQAERELKKKRENENG